jgi:hypothetical protein
MVGDIIVDENGVVDERPRGREVAVFVAAVSCDERVGAVDPKSRFPVLG